MRAGWPARVAAAAMGAALGIVALAGGALLLYSGEGFLRSAGLLMAVTLAGTAAGVWGGTPEAPNPRVSGRWMAAVLALIAASFLATAWLRIPVLQTTMLGPSLGVALFLGAPAYTIGALLAALHANRPGAVAVPGLLGAAAGVGLAAAWLIPSLPPGPVFFGAALLLTGSGTAYMALEREAMVGSLAGSVVLVTGAGKPGQVGFAVAAAFRAAGARVVVTARSEEEARAREAELRGDGDGAIGVAADLMTEPGAAAAVAAARDRWGRLDVVVNAAGGLRLIKPLAETTADEWSAEIERNARTAFVVSRAALPLLRQSQGAIINFASPAGQRAVARLGAYSAAKAGVIALTQALAAEEKASGVRVNAVAPGLVDTADNRAAAGASGDEGRFVSREAIAEAVLFLATAKGVTGEVLRVTNEDARADG